MSNYQKVDGPRVVFGGQTSGKTKGVGDIHKNGLVIQNVSYVEGLKFNLLSTSQFCDMGYKVEFSKDNCKVISLESGDTVLSARRRKNMYVVAWESAKPNVCLVAKSNSDLSWE